MRPHLILLILPALTGCQPIAPPAPSPSAPGESAVYKALGTEPFWALRIGNGTMSFEAPDGPNMTVTSYEARPSFNGWRYVSARITADITFTPCSDGMSDRRYHDTVIVLVAGQEYRGCGGAFSGPVAP